MTLWSCLAVAAAIDNKQRLCLCVFVVGRCSRSLAGLALTMERTDGGQNVSFSLWQSQDLTRIRGCNKRYLKCNIWCYFYAISIKYSYHPSFNTGMMWLSCIQVFLICLYKHPIKMYLECNIWCIFYAITIPGRGCFKVDCFCNFATSCTRSGLNASNGS